MEPFRVLIVGGGPAGLAAGITLGEAGIPTLVAERREYPVDKACGEGIMPTGVAALRRLGVDRYLDPGQFSPLHGIRYISPAGRSVRAGFREGSGWGVRRTALSAALLARAQETACLEVRSGVGVESLERRAGQVWAQVGAQRGGHRGGARIGVSLLIGADGLNSQVRRWAGLQAPAAGAQRYGARQHFAVQPWSQDVEVYWNRGVEAYVTPAGARQVGVAFLWDRALFRPPEGGAGLIPALLERFPALHSRLHGCAPLSGPRAAGPFLHRVSSPAADGVLLLGDAAGYVDALTGEGISLGLQAALLLGPLVAPLLSQPGSGLVSSAELDPFRQAYERLFTPYARMARLALFFSRQPRLLEAAVRLLGWQPWVFARLLSANMGAVESG